MKKIIALVFLALTTISAFAEQQPCDSVVCKPNPNLEEQEGELVIVNEAEAEALMRPKTELRLEGTRYETNAPVGDGVQLMALYKHRLSDKWEVIAKFNAIDRYDIGNQGGAVGAIYHKDKKALRIEITESGRAVLFPTRSIEAEYAQPIGKKLVGYASLKYSTYQQADLVNYLTSLAAEYYVGKGMIFARVFISHNDFDNTQDVGAVTGLIKYTRFITDDNRVWIYYANSNEHYERRFESTAGALKGNNVGIGGAYKVSKNWSIETNLEYQNRTDSDVNTYVIMMSLIRRW
jgi:YaiO family outer membrane protein